MRCLSILVFGILWLTAGVLSGASGLTASCPHTPGGLFKLPDDGNQMTQADSAVYYYGRDCQRHAFPNLKIYASWFAGFEAVQIWNSQTIASIPLGKNVTYRPGARLVKFATVNKVYQVSQGGRLRWVPSENLASQYFGSAWATRVDDVSDAFYGDYAVCQDIVNMWDYNVGNEYAAAQLDDNIAGQAACTGQIASPITPPPVTPTPTPTPTPAPSTPAAPTPQSSPGSQPQKQPPIVPLSQPGLHPRLLLTAAEIPTLRSWATDANPIYAKGLKLEIQAAVSAYQKMFPDGKPASPWPDNWSPAAPTLLIEAHLMTLALAHQVDPDPSKRAMYGKMAKDILVYAADEALKSGTPANDPRWLASARGQSCGQCWYYATDWIYDLLSTHEKSKVRMVFLNWAKGLGPINANVPVFAVNHAGLVDDPIVLAGADNNYRNGWHMTVALAGLVFDPEDDPPVDPVKGADVIGNTLRSFVNYEIGAWLYQDRLLMEGNPSSPSLPMRKPKRLPLEGGLYSYGAMSEALRQSAYVGLFTAGIRDAQKYGPNVSVVHPRHPYWTSLIQYYLGTLSPEPVVVPDMKYIGKMFQVLNHGQIERVFPAQSLVSVFGPLAIQARLTKDTELLNAMKWIIRDSIEGGAPDFDRRIRHNAMLNFLVFDPQDSTPITDPRPSLLPKIFVDESQGYISARTDLSANASWLGFICSYMKANHQMPYAGMFQWYRKGSWLTASRQGYFQKMGDAPTYHNILSVRNTLDYAATDPAYSTMPLSPAQEVAIPNYNLDKYQFERGGQMLFNAGDPIFSYSDAPTFLHAYCDSTNLYNRLMPDHLKKGNATDISHVSRSLVWLKPDILVIYDRAATKSAGKPKAFNLNTIDSPAVSGRTITSSLPDGQKLIVSSLLPANVSIITGPREDDFLQAGPDTMLHHVVIEDTNKTNDTRFLTVLQGLDAGYAPAAATLIQGITGTAYHGVVIGTQAVLFAQDSSKNTDGLAYEVPAQVTASYITGLGNNTGYAVSVTMAGNNKKINLAKGGSNQTDTDGVLRIDH